ncbi:MAG: WD40 repeat domain-containing protein [Armatimonadota bacterium]|nr:WD40 repeat domain-containing protein [Armatimonadota bacterium]
MSSLYIVPLAILLTATAAKIEPLGQPCRAKNILSTLMITDRETGRETLVLGNTNEATHMELIFLDFENDKAKAYTAPAGSGAWALIEVPGDRLIVGTHYDGMFMVFDLKKKEFVKTVKFPGESYIWNFAIGSDGRVYGGTYPGGKLGAFDLETHEVEDCGAPAQPNLYLRNVSSLPDGRILCSFGQEKPTTMVYDPKAKKWEPTPKQLEGITQGICWNGYFISGSSIFDSSLQPIKPPFPTPPADKGPWYVDLRLTRGDVLYIRQGRAIYRYNKGENALSLVTDVYLHGGGIVAASKKGLLIGIKGQDYFVIKPGDATIRLKPIPTESQPRPTLFLKADTRGRLWGGPHFGQTLFYLDTKTKHAVNTSNVSDHGGEVYDVAFYENSVYAVSYAWGEIIKFDPDKPWDQWNHKNPRTIAALNPKGYIRPIGGITLGPDNKLYSGWMAQYGAYGGAIAITDPKTEQTELIENPLGEQAIRAVVPAERYLYVGTSLAGNGLANKKGEPPKLGIIALSTKKVVWSKDIDGVGYIRPFAYDPESRRLAVSIGGKVQLFDTTKRELIADGEDIPQLNSNSTSEVINGIVYYGSENAVIALNLRTGKANRIVEAPSNISCVTADSEGRIYFACGTDVYVVKEDGDD